MVRFFSVAKDEIDVEFLDFLDQGSRIVSKVNELMAVCDQLEVQMTTAQANSRRLVEAVLRDALRPAEVDAEMA